MALRRINDCHLVYGYPDMLRHGWISNVLNRSSRPLWSVASPREATGSKKDVVHNDWHLYGAHLVPPTTGRQKSARLERPVLDDKTEANLKYRLLRAQVIKAEIEAASAIEASDYFHHDDDALKRLRQVAKAMELWS